MLSSWSISLVFHLVLFVILTFAVAKTMTEKKGVESERTAEVGLAFKTQDGEKMLYEFLDESVDGESESELAEAAASPSDVRDVAAYSEISNLISTDSTPTVPDVASSRPGLAPAEGDGSAGIRSVTDGLGNADHLSSGAFEGFGRGKVSCFNTSGEGSRFSFVFDRSGSMGGPGYSPIMAAKAELVRSLQSLQSNQQFQIIFYNEDPLVFPPGNMLLATDFNRREAFAFLSDVSADGGTDHWRALEAALKQHPDVVFFLTDADEPPLTGAELEQIRKNAAGTQINTIEFGIGPQTRKNFLARLAEMNGGQYVYLDIQQLRRGH